MISTHTLIVGGGIIGLTIAKSLLSKGVDDIIIIEKEAALGLHASGRNSGVMHAGVYYPPNTLKAQLCLSGARMMTTYCEQNNLPVNYCGKVIVAQDESQWPALNQLANRAGENGATVSLIDALELAEIEPNAKTVERALFVKDTAVIDPKKVVSCLAAELRATNKVRFMLNTSFVKRLTDTLIQTSCGVITYHTLYNASGSYADRVAKSFGLARDLTLIPFKGIYHKLKPEHAHLVNGNIYPIPNLNNPFLGVHFTKSIHGDVYCGPTAIPALGRENYGLLKGISTEAFKIVMKDAILVLTNKGFRHVAFTEPKKYIKSYFFKDCQALVKKLEHSWLESTPKVGIRPQLVNWKTKALEMDFLVERSDNTVHILNAVSPAFTSSMAFAEHLLQSDF